MKCNSSIAHRVECTMEDNLRSNPRAQPCGSVPFHSRVANLDLKLKVYATFSVFLAKMNNFFFGRVWGTAWGTGCCCCCCSDFLPPPCLAAFSSEFRCRSGNFSFNFNLIFILCIWPMELVTNLCSASFPLRTHAHTHTHTPHTRTPMSPHKIDSFPLFNMLGGRVFAFPASVSASASGEVVSCTSIIRL